MRAGLSALLISAALVMGCSAKIECSSEKVIATVQRIAAQKLAQVPQLQYIADPAKSRYNVTAIRTVSSDAKSCTCKANLHVQIELLEHLKKIRDTDKNTWEVLVHNNYRAAKQTDLRLDISYRAERTDDGKDIHVTVSGL